MPAETEDEKKRREQAEALKRNQTEFTVGSAGKEVVAGSKPVIRKTLTVPKAVTEEEVSPLGGAAAAAAKKRREQAAAVAPKK